MAPEVLSQNGRFNFLNRENYVAGGGLPNGKYACWFSWTHRPAPKDTSKAATPGVGVTILAVKLDDPTATPLTQFLANGKDFHKSWLPDTTNEGKSLVPVPGGPGSLPNEQTNWKLFLDSLFNCNLPEEVVSQADDFGPLDGIWLDIRNVPEPEGRKQMAALNTGDAQQQERKNATIPVAVEILEGGKPWENDGGGMPSAPVVFDQPVAQAAAPAPKRNAPPAAPAKQTPPAPGKKPGPAAPAPKPGPAGNGSAVDIDAVEVMGSACADVLSNNENGMKLLRLRMDAGNLIKKKHGEAVQTAVGTLFSDGEVVQQVLGNIGFALKGSDIVKA